MDSEELQVGDPVWAKMKGYPPWPAKIAEPPADGKSSKNKKSHFVYFFGSKNFAWIVDENISRHNESMLNTSKKRSAAYQSAIDELISYSKTYKSEQPKNDDKNDPEKEKEESTEGPKIKRVKILNNTKKKKERKVLKAPAKKVNKKREKKGGAGRALNDTNEKSPSPAASPSPDETQYPCFTYEPSTKIIIPHVTPSSKKFGFIGLGMMGGNIALRLLRSGHVVSIWNRSTYKYNKYVKEGAKVANTIADLILESDITFCCVSDSAAAKEVVFMQNGVLAGLYKTSSSGIETRKSFVQMSSIDPETSIELGEVIQANDAFYLEAPLYGTSEDAESGSLLILASGDRKTFIECETCFHAIGKHAYYISFDIGEGTKMSLILSMLSGTVCAALGESLCLAERLGLRRDDFINIVGLGPLSCETVKMKGEKMLERNFDTVTPLKHVQKDINLCMLMGNIRSNIYGKFSAGHFSMPVIAATNECYKRAKLRSLSEHDVSAIYKVNKPILRMQ